MFLGQILRIAILGFRLMKQLGQRAQICGPICPMIIATQVSKYPRAGVP
jgi:hypothetical protein